MKKLLLCSCVALTLISCGKDTTPKQETPNYTSYQNAYQCDNGRIIKIGRCQYNGFCEVMTSNGTFKWVSNPVMGQVIPCNYNQYPPF